MCLHPDQGAINQALLSREPFRNIAERFGTSTPPTMGKFLWITQLE
jgi:hypothetical protein